MRLGTKIKELRKKKGLTQIELSEKSGLTERTIQRIENHEVEPSKHSLKKIGEVLDCNLNEQKLNDMAKKQRILNFYRMVNMGSTLVGFSRMVFSSSGWSFNSIFQEKINYASLE